MSIIVLKQSFNLSRRIYSSLAIGLALCALTVSGNAMAIKSAAQGQDPNGATNQRKDESEVLQTNDENQNELDVEDAAKDGKSITGGEYNSMSEKQNPKEYLKRALQPFSFKSNIAGEGHSLYKIARESAAQLDKQFYIKQAKESDHAAGDKNSGTAYYDPSSGRKSTVSISFHF